MLYNHEAEREVLGSFLLNPDRHEYIETLHPDDFHHELHREVFKAMRQLYISGKPIDPVQLCEKLRGKCLISDITALTNVYPIDIEQSIGVIKDHAARRKLIMTAQKVMQMANDTETDVLTAINNALQEIEAIDADEDEEVLTLREAVQMAYEELERRYENRHDTSFYTGIKCYDIVTAGLHGEELTTIAARPGVGKTAWAMQIASHLARSGGKKVLYVILEMSALQIVLRYIAGLTGIDGNKLRRGMLNADDWSKIAGIIPELSLDNLILDKSSRNVAHIRSKIRRLKPDVVIIDYLTLLEPIEKRNSRQQEIGAMTRALKLMTLEFKIPIIQLAQLNRTAEGNRPTLASLREAGDIEQDSDNVVFLHQPGPRELIELAEKGEIRRELIDRLEAENKRLIQVIVEKQRNGPVGEFLQVYVPHLLRFVDVQPK